MSPKRLLRIPGHLANRWLRFIAPKRASITIDGMRFSVDPHTDIGFSLYRHQAFEFEEILTASAMCLARFPTQEFTILDVGANIGIHSLFLARTCEKARVIAFEPTPGTFPQLVDHIKINGFLERVTPVNIAISDKNGTADFYVTSDNAYNGLKDTSRKKLCQTLQVSTSKLDDWVKANPGPTVGLIKIDVEGLEHQVIRGAKEILTIHRPIIAVEIFQGAASNVDPEGTIRDILNFGYAPYVISNGLLKKFNSPHSDRLYNYIFMPL